MVYILENRTIDFKAEDLCHEGITAWTQLLEFKSLECHDMRENTKRILTFLLGEGILLPLLKAGADPNVKIYCPSSPPMTYYRIHRPMAVVYIELCFEFLDQPLVKQQLYLDVLEEFLRLSTISTVKAVCVDFRATRSGNAGVSPRHLPFLSRVNDLLSLHLDKFGAPGPKLLQDKWPQQAVPANPHTSINSIKGEKKRKKRENESDDVRCEGTRKR
ncbi:hypothetical protein PFICI_01622 [Pestalotiopsis fici W106-1]|uniref:Uncharacterized protein n=1 Tax=Pestalotiopsis fici (strain W106-1 / CGMCC3.15140) TaxID=1229662 RepID=W3XP96_PESFW|nr:uncharacterized protein PFICI_01622 [Pestalotiopsis fici W106-1]ETS87794.1 hypothetical protein PFICI_01622 [Pestalotiopsis fici W106-1]